MNIRILLSSSLLTATLLSAGDLEKEKLVGRVNTPGSVLINGVQSSGPGIAWSPVVTGDEVEAKDPSVLIRMMDKNRVTLGRDALVKLSKVANKHSYVYLRAGEVRFEPVVGRLFICALGHLYVPAEGSKGFVVVNSDHTIRAEDTLKSLGTSGNRACEETGAGLLLTGNGGGLGGSVGGASGGGLAAKGAIAAGVAAGTGYGAWRIRDGKNSGDSTPILAGTPPVSVSVR